MGLSRNKVAVSEGAAGSPPFYGDHDRFSRICRSRRRAVSTGCEYGTFVVQFLRIIEVLEKRNKPGNGGVAQLGEHLPCKQGVMGSIPIISTTQQRVGKQNPSGFEVIENRIKRRRVEKTDREDKDLDRVDRN